MTNPNLPFATPYEFDRHLIRITNHMTRTGIRVDTAKMLELHAQVEGEWEEYQDSLNKLVGFELNVMSSPQMKKLLYKELGLPKRMKKNNKGKRVVTADEDAIRASMVYAQDRINKLKTPSKRWNYQIALGVCRLTLLIRKRRKQLSSYLDIDLDPDGRARSTISVAGTETWRFSHSKSPWDTGLNLATVPRPLRIMYIPDEGCLMGEADLNRGESWVYSHLAEDPEMMRIHQEGGDFHSETASIISTAFGADPLTVDEIIARYEEDDAVYYLRYMGKRVNHATAYKMGPFKGAEVINEEADETGIVVTVSQVKKAQTLWVRKYMGIPMWWDWIERTLSRTRKLITPYGRHRIYHDHWGDKLLRDAVASIPQSTSVDYMNYGMFKFYNFTQSKENKYDLKLLHQNHDSVLFQFREDALHEVMPKVKSLLTSDLTLTGISGKEHTIQIPIEVQYGRNWREMKLYGETA